MFYFILSFILISHGHSLAAVLMPPANIRPTKQVIVIQFPLGQSVILQRSLSLIINQRYAFRYGRTLSEMRA